MNPGSSTAWLCNPQGGLESFVILCECDPQEADALMSQVIPATLKLDMARHTWVFCAFKFDLSKAGKRQILRNFADMVDDICIISFCEFR